MTAQVADKLIYAGKEILLFSNPLTPYLASKNITFVSPHTANWRGYVASWEILEEAGVKKLYLVKLSAHRTYEDIVGLSDIFPDCDKVFAQWFTGTLRCPQGAELEYVHMGYASIYEYDLFMEFEDGILIKEYARQNQPPQKKPESEYPPFLRRGK